MLDAVYPEWEKEFLAPLFSKFNFHPKKTNLVDVALKGYPKDVDYMHIYCTFGKWIDDRHAVLKVRMYTCAQKYYDQRDRKMIAGIDREFVYEVGKGGGNA